MKTKLLILISILLLPLKAFADPAPIGLEIGYANYKDLADKFQYADIGIDPVSNGRIVSIDRSSFDFEGLKVKKAQAIFNKENFLIGLTFILPESEYKRANHILVKKYDMVNLRERGSIDRYKVGNTEAHIFKLKEKPDIQINFIGDEYRILQKKLSTKG